MESTSFIPKTELQSRIARLQTSLVSSGLDAAFITDIPDMLYYTGTIQNGIFFAPSAGDPVLFTRRSLERARMESPISTAGFRSFSEISAELERQGLPVRKVGIDEGATTLASFKMLKKYFPAVDFTDVSLLLKKIRAVKTPYELEKLVKAGEASCRAIASVPSMVHEGMTEWELSLSLFRFVSDTGRNCLSRHAFGSGEFFLGTVNFGDSSNYPVAFDGPGGLRGKSPVCPNGGSDRRLKKGDLIYIDIVYPYEEYYVDKTRIFSLGRPPQQALEAHARCLEVQESARKRLVPGAIPSKIYEEVYTEVVSPNRFDEHFMGYGGNKVKFLGHGIGLVVNEYPVIARKFDDPLLENMVIAVEPKKGIEGIGMVGIENTYIVKPGGGINLTADNDEIVEL